MSFCWIRVFLLYKGRGKEDGVGGWGLTGTPIDMSSSYLRNEFFFSLELRRHTDTTLHFGHLHGNKCKQIRSCFKSEVVSNQKLFQGQFVPLHYASLLCIILYDICTSTYANRRFLVLFFLPGRIVIAR